MRLLPRRKPKPGTRWDGRVAFVDGSHYAVPADGDLELGPDMRLRLRWVPELPEGGHYVIAAPEDPNHNAFFHERFVELDADGRSIAELEADPARPEGKSSGGWKP